MGRIVGSELFLLNEPILPLVNHAHEVILEPEGEHRNGAIGHRLFVGDRINELREWARSLDEDYEPSATDESGNAP